MKIKRFALASFVSVLLAGFGNANSAFAAADIPCNTAKMIVPWSPGGDTDIVFRLVIDTINNMDVEPTLQVVNVSGQSGNKGAKEVRSAEPNGCTLLALHESQITTYLAGRVDFTWDAFQPVALLTYTPSVLGAHADVPYDNLKEFIAYAKEHPGEIKVGVTAGSTSHFIMLLIEEATGAKFNYIPYEGTRERLTALLAHNIDVGEMNILTAKQYLKEGSMKPLGIATEKRDPLLPDLPTFQEQGYDIVYGLHRGVVLPKGADPAVVEHYAGLFRQAMKDPKVKKNLGQKGTWIVFKGSEGYAEFLNKSYDEHERVATKVGMYEGE